MLDRHLEHDVIKMTLFCFSLVTYTALFPNLELVTAIIFWALAGRGTVPTAFIPTIDSVRSVHSTVFLDVKTQLSDDKWFVLGSQVAGLYVK